MSGDFAIALVATVVRRRARAVAGERTWIGQETRAFASHHTCRAVNSEGLARRSGLEPPITTGEPRKRRLLVLTTVMRELLPFNLGIVSRPTDFANQNFWLLFREVKPACGLEAGLANMRLLRKTALMPYVVGISSKSH